MDTALSVMHSYTIPEPPPHCHVMHKGGLKSVAWMILFNVKALTVWLVGIGIKIALFDPIASVDAFFAHDQRLQLGLACALCYGTTLVMAPLHTSLKEFYFGTKLTPLFKLVEVLNISAMLGATWLRVEPYEYIMIQMVLGVIHMTSTQLELVWLPAFCCRKEKSPIYVKHEELH